MGGFGGGAADDHIPIRAVENNPNFRYILYLFFANVFFACTAFSAVLPSLWPYLQETHSTTTFLAVTVSIYSVGEGAGSLIFGPLANVFSPRTSMLLCLALGLCGSVVYCAGKPMALAVGDNAGQYSIFLGRLVQGLWSGGQQTVEQTYLSENVSAAMRTEYTAMVASFACLGFLFGPTFSMILNACFDWVHDPGFEPAPDAWINKNTIPGYFILFVSTLMFVLTYLIFVNPEHLEEADENDEETGTAVSEYGAINSARTVGNRTPFGRTRDFQSNSGVVVSRVERRSGSVDITTVPSDGETSEEDDINTSTGEKIAPPSKVGIGLCYMAFLVLFQGFSIQETIPPPLTQLYYGWTVQECNMIFTIAGAIALIATFGIRYLRAWSDYAKLVFAMIIGLVGYAMLVQLEDPDKPANLSFMGMDFDLNPDRRMYPEWRFLVGFFIINLSFPIGRAVVLGLHSRIIGPRPQGRYAGYIIAIGSISRILGPFYAVKAFMWSGPSLVFGSTAVLFLLCLLLMWMFNHHMNEHPAYSANAALEAKLEDEEAKAGGDAKGAKETTPLIRGRARAPSAADLRARREEFERDVNNMETLAASPMMSAHMVASSGVSARLAKMFGRGHRN